MRNLWADACDLKSCIFRSRRRIGRCEFSARTCAAAVTRHLASTRQHQRLILAVAANHDIRSGWRRLVPKSEDAIGFAKVGLNCQQRPIAAHCLSRVPPGPALQLGRGRRRSFARPADALVWALTELMLIEQNTGFLDYYRVEAGHGERSLNHATGDKLQTDSSQVLETDCKLSQETMAQRLPRYCQVKSGTGDQRSTFRLTEPGKGQIRSRIQAGSAHELPREASISINLTEPAIPTDGSDPLCTPFTPHGVGLTLEQEGLAD